MLFVNTKSRRGKDWFAKAKSCLQANGVCLEECVAVRNPAQITTVVQGAISRKIPLVIIGGGDGTLSAVARYFVGSDSVMGVLPLGTGNAFARDLGIETDVAKACDVMVHGKVAAVDLGIAGDDYFLNVATVGLSTLVARELTNDAKHSWGQLVYLIALWRALLKVKPFVANLITDQGEQTIETLQIVIGNGRFHAGPFPLDPNASITDGKLIVYAVVGTSRWELLRYATNLFTGRQVKLPDVPTYWTTQGELRTTPRQRVTVDGEIIFDTPLRFGISSGVLQVMVPTSFGE